MKSFCKSSYCSVNTKPISALNRWQPGVSHHAPCLAVLIVVIVVHRALILNQPSFSGWWQNAHVRQVHGPVRMFTCWLVRFHWSLCGFEWMTIPLWISMDSCILNISLLNYIFICTQLLDRTSLVFRDFYQIRPKHPEHPLRLKDDLLWFGGSKVTFLAVAHQFIW